MIYYTVDVLIVRTYITIAFLLQRRIERPKEPAKSPIKGQVTVEDEERMRKLLPFHLAPEYLQFNPFILHGYRGYLTTKLCLERYY